MVQISPKAQRLQFLEYQNQRQKVQAALQESAKKAEQFMDRLFRGDKLARCVCGSPVKYKNGELRCDDCGKRLNRVEYVNDYPLDELDRVYVQTVIDVDKRQFLMKANDCNDFSEENTNGDDRSESRIILP